MIRAALQRLLLLYETVLCLRMIRSMIRHMAARIVSTIGWAAIAPFNPTTAFNSITQGMNSMMLRKRFYAYMIYKCEGGKLKGVEKAAFHLHCSPPAAAENPQRFYTNFSLSNY